MQTQQSCLDTLSDPIAQELLHSDIPARLAYTWHDGTPRVVPMWFHWDGHELVLGGPPDAPKIDAIEAHPDVALTIDGNDWPYKSLLIRGTARVDVIPGLADEYVAAAERYLGLEQGQRWVGLAGSLFDRMGRIAVRPTHVTVIDLVNRFPSKIASRLN